MRCDKHKDAEPPPMEDHVCVYCMKERIDDMKSKAGRLALSNLRAKSAPPAAGGSASATAMEGRALRVRRLIESFLAGVVAGASLIWLAGARFGG